MRAGSLLLKLFILLGLLVVADLLLGTALDTLFWKQKSGKYFTTSHALKDCKEDILIFGNSHAAQDFNPVLIKEKSGKPAFNFGNQGQGILYSIYLIKSILAYHQPKLIILNLDYRELQRNPLDYERLGIFLPYYHQNRFIDSAIASSGKYESLKARSALYRYNSTIGYMLLNTYKSSYNKSMATMGYDPMTGNICESIRLGKKVAADPGTNDVGVMDNAKVDLLISTIKYIQSRGIHLLVTTTPMYEYHNAADVYKLKLAAVLNGLHVDYLDYGENAAFKGNCSLFFDNSHLNTIGADKWTDVCIGYIRKYPL